MAKRRQKRRTHVTRTEDEESKIPKSMVLKMGDKKREVTHTLAQLVRDFRNVMQPHTAARLRERKRNKLKDFITMAGPLGVSHLFLFSVSTSGNTTLRVGRTPRGPTLNFKVTQYSLCKDVAKFVKSPKSLNNSDFVQPPLLVMNNFTSEKSEDAKEALVTSMFQNMFPPISAQTISLSSIKRVLMLNKREDGTIDVRHYAIETKKVEGSKAVRRLSTVGHKLQKRVPNMRSASDISEYLLDPNGGAYTSESEIDDEDAMVQVTDRPRKRKAETTQKRAIKLVEIGPRLRLELRKIEEGLCEGKTLYHSSVSKSKKEQQLLDERHEQKRKLKERRRKDQEERVKQKQQEKEGKMSRTKRGILKAQQKAEAAGASATGSNGSNGAADADDSDVDMEADVERGADSSDDSDIFSDNDQVDDASDSEEEIE
uniref:ARAD1D31262p n=1 Tax=Blastobotrys adeninivorans TaxID=409370 RepID=A0A060TB23_BLAAD